MGLNIDERNTAMGDAFREAQDRSGTVGGEETTFANNSQMHNLFRTAGLVPYVNYHSGSEELEALYKYATELIESVNKAIVGEKSTEKPLAVTRLLASTNDLRYSGIVISNSQGGVTAIHTLLVEATGDYPESQTLDFENGYTRTKHEFIIPPSFAFDLKLAQKSMAVVRDNLRIPTGQKIRWVEGTMIPKEYRLTQNIENRKVEAIIGVAIKAVQAEVSTALNKYYGVSMNQMKKQFGNFYTVDVEFPGDMHSIGGGSTAVDVTGLPVRQDIKVTLSIRPQNRNKREDTINHSSGGSKISEVSGYIDFIWKAPEQNNQFNMNPFMQAMQQNFLSMQTFMANFVITNIDSPTYLMTEHISALALASVGSIWQNRTWVQAFSRKYAPSKSAKSKLRYDDVGVLAIEAGQIVQSDQQFGVPTRVLGQYIDTTAKDFDFTKVQNMINALVSPNMLISIDVPESGPNTWSTSIFRSIAKLSSPAEDDRAEATAAAMRFNNAVSVLMGGGPDNPIRFQDPGVPMFVDWKTLIHGGYFVDDKEIRDLRYLSSYLTVAAFLHDHGQAYDRLGLYNGTMTNYNLDPRIRASSQFALINEMSMETAVVKEYYTRLTFHGGFFSSLINQLKATGFNVDMSTIQFGDNVFAPVTHDYSAIAVDPSVTIASAFGYNQSVTGSNFNFVDRSWGLNGQNGF